MSSEPAAASPSKPARRHTRFLKRHIVTSDHHGFIGRVYDLGIVSLNFDSYDDLAKYPDCKYAVDTGHWLENLARRVESLNLVGDMLWPSPLPSPGNKMPISRYEWLTVATDAFLVRYVSVVDCALLTVNQVYQFGLSPRNCTMSHLKKAGLPTLVFDHLRDMLDEQEQIRHERNARVHHGRERQFTDDDMTFRTASLFNDKLNGMTGHDRYGRKIDVDLSFREGLVSLQRDFNLHLRQIERQLDQLYEYLWDEFEDRFGPLIAAATHGLNACARPYRPEN